MAWCMGDVSCLVAVAIDRKQGQEKAKDPHPNPLNSREMEDVEAIETVAQFLEDNARPFTPREIRKAIERKDIHVGGDLEAFIWEVQERGLTKTREILEVLWGFLDIPPLDGVEKWLRDGALLEAWGSTPGAPDLDVAIVMDYGDSRSVVQRKSFSGARQYFDLTSFNAKAGLETIHSLSFVYGVKERAVFEVSSLNHLESYLERLRGLRPILSAMGLSDLEGAVERLPKLEKGESRIEGPYVLARDENPWGGDIWVLRRGPIFGIPELDGTLLTKREATLRFPGDVEFSFRIAWMLGSMSFDRLRIRWGEEEVDFRHPHMISAHSLAKNPVTEAIQSGLIAEIAKLEVHGKSEQFRYLPSPKMLALLKAFSKHEDPFGALAEGRLLAHAKAEFFLDF